MTCSGGNDSGRVVKEAVTVYDDFVVTVLGLKGVTGHQTGLNGLVLASTFYFLCSLVVFSILVFSPVSAAY